MLEQKQEVQVTEISRQTGISEVTIRKDLTILQNRHLLLRTRGGAMKKPVENMSEDTAIAKKRMFNFKEKERIGEEAVKLIREGDFIMLDSGTTTLEIARHLDRFQNLRIITNSMNIATELMAYSRTAKENATHTALRCHPYDSVSVRPDAVQTYNQGKDSQQPCTADIFISHPYGTFASIVCNSEMCDTDMILFEIYSDFNNV
jgi:DeoR/GlpR family transcriptional regulator of sugar metabolism